MLKGRGWPLFVSATALAGTGIVAGAIVEFVHHQTMVVPQAIRAFLDNYDLENPSRYEDLSPARTFAFFIESEVGRECPSCFALSILDHVEHVYTRKTEAGVTTYYEILRDCPEGKACVRRSDIAAYVQPVSQDVVIPKAMGLGSRKNCSERRIEGFGARFCHVQIFTAGELHFDRYYLEIEPARSDLGVRMFGQGSLQSSAVVEMNWIVGNCIYGRLGALAANIVEEHCEYVE